MLEKVIRIERQSAADALNDRRANIERIRTALNQSAINSVAPQLHRDVKLDSLSRYAEYYENYISARVGPTKIKQELVVFNRARIRLPAATF